MVDEGSYANAESVVKAALELLEERDRRRQWLRDELAIGEEQERQGALIDLTPKYFANVVNAAIENAPVDKSILNPGKSL